MTTAERKARSRLAFLESLYAEAQMALKAVRQQPAADLQTAVDALLRLQQQIKGKTE